ncbi:MAG: hypothetical protein R3E86_15285 [Pseudomonadales bacterium]
MTTLAELENVSVALPRSVLDPALPLPPPQPESTTVNRAAAIARERHTSDARGAGLDANVLLIDGIKGIYVALSEALPGMITV